MVIYGEYLFLENFITGIVITHFTGKIAGYRMKRYRTLLSGIGCGIYAFVLFTDFAGLPALAGKIGFALGISWLAYGNKSAKSIFQGGILFFLVTVFYGGIALAILSSFGWQGITAAAGVYMPAVTYLTVSAAASAAALVLQFAANLLRTKRQRERTRAEVILRIGDKTWPAKGLVDSGNLLHEPLSGRPVAVVSRALMDEVQGENGGDPARFAAVPFRSVGVKKGILTGYRIDELTALGVSVKKPVLAVWEDGGFLADEEETRQILLPAALMERGIYAEVDGHQRTDAEAVSGSGK